MSRNKMQQNEVIRAILCLLALLMVLANAFSPSFCPTTRRQTASALGFFNFGKPEEPPKKEQEEKENSVSAASQGEDEPDLVEKLFTTFFGKPESEPFGLKRFDSTRFPEQYPATTTDFDVEPVATDDRDMAQLRPLLKNTNLETRGLRLTYDASRDGWDAYKFHQIVDKQGPALVVCQTRMGLLCGGYNPKGWVGMSHIICCCSIVCKKLFDWNGIVQTGPHFSCMVASVRFLMCAHCAQSQATAKPVVPLPPFCFVESSMVNGSNFKK